MENPPVGCRFLPNKNTYKHLASLVEVQLVRETTDENSHWKE